MRFKVVKGNTLIPKDKEGVLSIVDTTDSRMFDLIIILTGQAAKKFMTHKMNKSKMIVGGQFNIHQGDPTKSIRVEII